MRVEKANNDFAVYAVSGTHVVLIALNCGKDQLAGLRGFAFQRAINGGKDKWLTGLKVFKSLVPKPDKGHGYPTNEHPIQSFLWSDYATEPGTNYTFTISAMYGTPGNLTPKKVATFTIRTEDEIGDDGHGVWFNRGAIASQAFARKFKNKSLSEAEYNNEKNEEVKWLSRGLLEACLTYINKTEKGEGLRVCAYEFTYRPVLIALANAITRGVDVAIVYHGVTANETAVGQAGLPKTNKGKKILFTRTKTEIPHNKFIVKLNKQGAPIELWTGSTNFTSSGFLGQTNVGHLVVDSKTAETYLKFWERLSTDPDPDQAKANAISLTKNPANTIPAKPISIVFSPRPSSKMLAWYSQRIADAASSVMFTGAFGVDATILAGIARPNPGMRFVLLEKPPSKEIKAAVKANPGQVVVSFGAVLSKETGHDTEGKPTKKLVPIPHSELDKWFLSEELERRSGDGFVFFIHTKFLLVDPLSDDPLVCSGSANFSRNSLTANDENMLLIRGDKRVADIYFTEFDRIFRHFYFRDVANDLAHDTKSDDDAIFLKEDGSWTAGYFKPGSSKTRRRELFFANSKNTWVAKAKADPDPFKGEAVAKGAKAASGKKSKPPAKKPKGKPS